MFDLSGKVVLVTGAAGAIGSAITRVLHRQGATLVISGTRNDSLKHLAMELTERVHIFVCDLASEVEVNALIPNVEEACGHVDILVNNAGIVQDDLLIRMTDESWRKVLMVNLEAPFRLMRAAALSMIKARWGRIINISSIVGAIGNPGQSNYAAAKSGMFGLSKSLAKEVAKRNITVNCVAPGFIQSRMTEAILATHREEVEKNIPMARIGRPEEVAAAVGFLASNEASYITGQVLHVNGGMAMV
ncbi:MAG: 3-oxoacyl-[acyl-carrier-protein] reductase [Holosporaceae bacterium]|nr:3-oxoacyl-[acyl-carrier-protein] reductase [Holosporaceae bacterium]